MTGRADSNSDALSRPGQRLLEMPAPPRHPDRSAQIPVATGIAVGVLLVVCTTRAASWTLCADNPFSTTMPVSYRIDINRATWIEWTPMDGVGETLARRITANRRRNGRFVTVDDLRRVKGIGPRTIDRLRPWLIVGPDNRHSAADPEVTSTGPG